LGSQDTDSAGLSQRIEALEHELAASRRALARTDARLQIFATQTAFWVWETDAEHCFVHLSDNVEPISGIRADELLGRNWLQTARRETSPDWVAHADNLDHSRPFENFRFQRQDSLEDRRHLVLSGWPVFDQRGRFRGYRGVGRDETDEVRERERLRSIEAGHVAEIEAQRDALLRRTEDFAHQTECWFWETDDRHIFTYVSGNVERLAGLEAARIVGTSRFDLAPANPHDPDWLEHVDDLTHHRRFDAFHFVRPDAQGEPRHIMVSGWPRFDRSGNFLGYRGTGRDETAMVKRFEEQARREQAYIAEIECHNGEIEMVLSNLSQGIIWFDAERNVRFQNGRVAEIFDLAIGDLAECLTALDCMRLLARRGDFGGSDSEALAKSQTDAIFDQRTGPQSRWWLKSLDRHLRCRYGRLGDGGLIVTFVDISDDVRIEQELASARDEARMLADESAERERALQTVLDNLSQSIMWFDKDRKIKLRNHKMTQMHGFTEAEYRGVQSFDDHVRLLAERGDMGQGSSEEIIAASVERIFAPMDDPQDYRRHFPVRDRHFLVRLAPTPDGGRILSEIDITDQARIEMQLAAALAELEAMNAALEHKVNERTRELRQTQASLVEAERDATLGKLTAKLSHELRNPLNALNTSLYIIRAKAGGDDRIARALDRSERTVQRCTNILADLYDFAMTVEAKPRLLDLGPWLADVLGRVRVPEGVHLRIDNRLKGMISAIDDGQLAKALHKIIDNAFLAVTQEGLERAERIVSVVAAHAADRIEIIVADNGPGMDEATASQAREPLFSTRGFGVGLGLPIAEQTLARHGGGLKLYSRRRQGTTITLWLPAGSDEHRQAA